METNALKIKKGKRKRSHMAKNRIQLWILAAIPILHIVIFHYLPMIGIVIPFKDYRYDKGILGSEWVGFKNFEYFFRSDDLWVIIRNTVGMNLIFIACGIICALALAIAYYELKSVRKLKVYQTVIMTPSFISMVVVGYMAYAFLNPEQGFINTFLVKIGLSPIAWYSVPAYWPFILTVVSVWKSVGMKCILYYSTLMGLDSEMLEAAEIDGANKWQQIIKIIVPSLVPVITILTILDIGGIFSGDFGLFYYVPRNVGVLYPTTDIINTYVYRTLRVVGDVGMSSAVGLMQSVVGLIMVVLTNTIVKKIDPERSLF